VRKVFLTGEKAQERPPLLGHVIANGAPQHRVTRLQGIEDESQSGIALNIKLHLSLNLRKSPEMVRKHDANHGND
jgi:hypothetical protein